jgi:hypothetical protein
MIQKYFLGFFKKCPLYAFLCVSVPLCFKFIAERFKTGRSCLQISPEPVQQSLHHLLSDVFSLTLPNRHLP